MEYSTGRIRTLVSLGAAFRNQGTGAANRGARRCRLYLLISLERVCETRGSRDKGIVKGRRRRRRRRGTRRTYGRPRDKGREGRRWTVTDGNTSSPSWLLSYRRTCGQTAETRRTGFTQTRVTNNRFVRNSWVPLLGSARVLFSPPLSPPSFCRSVVDAVVSFRFPLAPGQIVVVVIVVVEVVVVVVIVVLVVVVGFIPLGSPPRQWRSPVAAGPLGGDYKRAVFAKSS